MPCPVVSVPFLMDRGSAGTVHTPVPPGALGVWRGYPRRAKGVPGCALRLDSVGAARPWLLPIVQGVAGRSTVVPHTVRAVGRVPTAARTGWWVAGPVVLCPKREIRIVVTLEGGRRVGLT